MMKNEVLGQENCSAPLLNLGLLFKFLSVHLL